MTQQEIQEAFTISRFMGYTYPDASNEIFLASLDLHNYREDWNKLMGVVREVSDTALIQKVTTSKQFGRIYDLHIFSDIEDAYSAVLQFITWYNQQKPQP